MDNHVENCSAAIERVMFHNYNAAGNLMQEKLQELYATLDRICK